MRGAHGIHNASAKLERNEFRNYVRSLNLEQQFPGVRGFGFIVKVPREELAQFEQRERADQAADFAVKSSGQARDLL